MWIDRRDWWDEEQRFRDLVILAPAGARMHQFRTWVPVVHVVPPDTKKSPTAASGGEPHKLTSLAALFWQTRAILCLALPHGPQSGSQIATVRVDYAADAKGSRGGAGVRSGRARSRVLPAAVPAELIHSTAHDGLHRAR